MATSVSRGRKVATARRQGERAGLDVDQIMETASAFEPSAITMRGIAARLGVDHKALNHYVADRDTLLGLLAWRQFGTHFSDRDPWPDDWRQACLEYSEAVLDAAVAVGALVDHLNLRGAPLAGFVVGIEDLVATLVTAGFADEQALRGAVVLSNVCIAHARDLLAAQASASHPRTEMVRAALAQSSNDRFPHLTRILDAGIDTYAREQFDFAVRVVIRGLESELPARSPRLTH